MPNATREEQERDVTAATTEIAVVDIKDSLRPKDVNLRMLVSHRTAVQVNDTVESVFNDWLDLFCKNRIVPK
jgi:hypothetical protein